LHRLTHEYVDLYNAGALVEFDSGEPPMDWADFAERAVELCRRYDVPCYVRRDAQPEPEGEAPNVDAAATQIITEFVDTLMCEDLWREMCLMRKPRWGVSPPPSEEALKSALEWSCARQHGLW
jgi:hypothetical protein